MAITDELSQLLHKHGITPGTTEENLAIVGRLIVDSETHDEALDGAKSDARTHKRKATLAEKESARLDGELIQANGHIEALREVNAAIAEDVRFVRRVADLLMNQVEALEEGE